MRILVVAAHPDDEVLGCGGSIVRMAQEGHNISVAILGEGISSRYKHREEAKSEIIQELYSRSHRVAEMLGVQNLSLHGLPDNRFDTVPLLDVVKIIEELLSRISPEVIYTHHGGDLNIDHTIVHRAVLTASRPSPHHTVREIYAFEIPSSTEWSFHSFEPVFRPNVFVDITNTLDTKVQALAEYESEIRSFPHPRSSEALRALAARWGTVAGCEAAEAFALVRSIH